MANIFDAIKFKHFDEFIGFLNNPDFDPNIKTEYGGYTPLMFLSIYENELEWTKELLKKNPNINEENVWGQTALTLMTGRIIKDTDIINFEFIIGRGADINHQDPHRGITPLMTLLRDCTETEVLRVLPLFLKSNLNLKNKDDWTALMFAAQNNFFEIVRILLQEGADPNVINIRGESLLNHSSELLQLYLSDFITNKKITIPEKIIQYKLMKAKNKLKKYKNKLNETELELLTELNEYNDESESCEKRLENLELLKETIKNAKRMVKLKPESEKIIKLGIKYKDHSYFQK